MSIAGDRYDDEYSVIGDKGEIGFIDFEDDKSVCTYDPSDEGNVVVSVPFPIVGQKPQSVFVNEYTAEAITIRNTTSDSVELWGIQIYASNPEDSFTLSLMEPSSKGFVGASSLEDRVLQPLKTLIIWLSCKPKDIGLHTCIVHFDVGDEKIERVVFLLAEDTISQSLSSNKPYQRGRRRNAQFGLDSYVGGVRPARKTKHIFLNKLPFYDIPKDVREVLENGQIPDAVFRGLSRKNYVNYFKTLLIMEELRLEEDIRAYDMEEATLRSCRRQYLILEVLGLAERRPSLVHGDSVFARIANVDANGTPVYEGCIHRVEADQVYLRFADEFHRHHRDEIFYNIRFMYNRVNMRRLYQAVEAAEALPSDFLFPSETGMKRHITPNLMVPISSNLNEEQLNAVEMILGCKGGPPYVINGPPGTGKTMTLVEAILQIYKTRGGSRILICASSNSAADHILEKILNEKLIQVRENEIFRLNASTRPYEDIKPDYIRFCFFDESIFRCPPLQALLRYRIIITTYMSTSLLYAEGVKRGHFSHIILDEAGQASEPETMVPIANLYRKETVVVLAGDPLQLGPVIFSDEAKNNGLGTSYLERLFESTLYGDGDEGYVTTLRRNYRCHPEILLLPSKLFYSGELISCRETLKSTPWDDLLPNKEFPILFIGVQGYDEREGDNPSWFNRLEASMVVKFIKKLTSRDVSEEDIGVITPYRQQVAKIRKALENSDIIDVKIGSVEQFQGQEREAIIVSTVRSTVKHDEFDRVHYLGFLSNSKRFNVAITRAKSLLVIIGNPHIICKDPYWEQLLWRCVDNKSYEGCSLPERQIFYDDVQGQESYPNLEQECFQVSGQDQEHPWDEQGPDGNWEEEKLVKDGDWEGNKPVGDGDWEENEPVGDGDWEENEPVGDGDWEEDKPVGDGDWQEDKPVGDGDWQADKRVGDGDWQADKRVGDGDWQADKRVGDGDWQEDKCVGDGDWQEDKPVVDGQDCPWYDLKPIEGNNNGRDCSWKEDQLVEADGNV